MSRRKVKEEVEAEPELSAEEEVEIVESDVETPEPEDPEPEESERPPAKTGTGKPKLRKDGKVDRRREAALKNLEKARAVRAQRAKEAREARAEAVAAGHSEEKKKKKTTSHVVETVIEDGSDESETEFELVPVSKAKKVSKTAKATKKSPDQMQAFMEMQKLWMQTMMQGQAQPASKKRPTKIVTKVQVPASKPEFSEHTAPAPAKKEPAKVDPAEQLRRMMFG